MGQQPQVATERTGDAEAPLPQPSSSTTSSSIQSSTANPMSLGPALNELSSTLRQQLTRVWASRRPHTSPPSDEDLRQLADAVVRQRAALICTICHDLGWVQVEAQVEAHTQGVVTARDVRLVRCACQAESDARERQQRLRRLSGLDPQRRWLTFDAFDPSVDAGAADALVCAQAFAADPFGYGWVTLFGESGLGKTHLLEAIAGALIAHGIPTLYVSAADLLAVVKRGFDRQGPAFAHAGADDSAEERIQQAATADVLLLDDLGAQSATPWADETLWRILDARYRRRHAAPTMVASNCKPRELEPRIGSRIRDKRLCHTVTLLGDDYRLREIGEDREE